MLDTIHQEINTLPSEALELLLNFIYILKKCYANPKISQPQSSNNLPLNHRRQKGSAKGKLIIHAEDDDHLRAYLRIHGGEIFEH
jgi:Protein of unknown function (DUF2281)